MSAITVRGISKARRLLAELSSALRSAPTVAREEAAAEVRTLLDSVARSQVSRHKDTGYSSGALIGAVEGSRVLVKFPRYLKYQSWFSFRDRVPAFLVKAASTIYARKLLAHLGAAGYEGADAAAGLVAAADASSAKKARAKEDSKRRRAERAYDRQVKKQEAQDHG